VKLIVLSSFLVCAACGTDPVSYSAPVGINLKAKSGDVAGTAISEDKSITTETSNPYGGFVSAATSKIGRAPGRIEVDHATLLLGAQSINVTKLEDVFTGAVDVSFVINDSNNTYQVGILTNPSGVGPIDLDISLSGAEIAPQDFTKYLDGSFKVVTRGTAAAGFTSKGAEAALQLTFTFAAFE
jgi:5-hydroxyisourate hydrolase-like protein (transthyretin family)